MDNVLETSSIIEETSMLSVGAVLRATREEQGLTIADVAERIKFSVKQLEALESGKSEGLPEGAFLRGFVRSYARTLHLDEMPLLARMSPIQGQHGDVGAVQAGGLEFVTADSPNRKNLYLMLVALFVAITLAIFIWDQKDEPIVEKTVLQEVALPEMAPASAVEPTASGESAASAVIAETKLEQELPTPKVVELSKVVVTPKAISPATSIVAEKPKVVEGSFVVVTPTAVVEKPTLPLDQLKKRPIHIVFTHDSWMEIKDINGELLLSRMNVAGTEKWIGGGRRAPYQVAIGKVEAVKIFYKGREVDLSKYSQTGVVRFVLE